MRMSEMTDAYVKLDKVSKIYGTKEVKIVAVDEISFEIAKGEFVVIVGPSGAGKTFETWPEMVAPRADVPFVTGSIL